MSSLLKFVPRWFRFKWPFRRYFYQPEDLEAAKVWAAEFRREMGWDDDAG